MLLLLLLYNYIYCSALPTEIHGVIENVKSKRHTFSTLREFTLDTVTGMRSLFPVQFYIDCFT